jgi:hypothetical protein
MHTVYTKYVPYADLRINFTILEVICDLLFLYYTFKYIFVYSFTGNHLKEVSQESDV